MTNTGASPRQVERNAPCVGAALDVARGARKAKADLERAAAVAEDFRGATPR